MAYVDESDLSTLFADAKAHAKVHHEPFDEFERLARNLPHPGIAKHLPKVTDGSIAAHLRERPKRVVQQIPTGSIITTEPWMKIVGDWLLANEILPNSNEVAALISKCWALIGKAETYGSQPAYVRPIMQNGILTIDWTLPYVRDILLEPGKLSETDSNVIMLRSWWTKAQIDAIVDREDMLEAKAKGRKENYEAGWNTGVLKALKDHMQQKDAQSQSPNEKKRPTATTYGELVHVFQKGVGAEFYSFAPALEDGSNIARTKVNKDPRGVIPIHSMYIDQDWSNQLGRGTVELGAPLQNLIDGEMQMYQYRQALGLASPIKTWGNVRKSTLKFEPNAIWDMGQKKDMADAELVELGTNASQSFSQNYSFLKSQLIGLLTGGGGDNSISSDTGNPSYSKTPAGVQAQEQRLGTNDNQVRKSFEHTFQAITETQVNLYFAERSGSEDFTLDAETAGKLKQIQPKAVNDKNVIRINFDSETPKLNFKVDPTSSNVKDDDEQSVKLNELLQQVSQDPLIAYRMSQDGYKLNVGEAYKEAYNLLGIKNIDKIITEMSDQEKQQAQQAPMPMLDKPKLTVAFDDLKNNPAAQQGVLANAGVNLPIEAFQQAAQAEAQANAAPAPDQNDPANHPFVKMMDILNIKFETLDATTQKVLIQQIFGINSPDPTPSAQNMAIQAQDAQLRADQQAHSQQIDTAKAHLDAAKTAATTAQVVHSQSNADRSHEMAMNQAASAKEVTNGKPTNAI